MKQHVGLVVAGVAALAIGWRTEKIDQFFECQFMARVRQDPEQLTRLRILEPKGIDSHNPALTDASDAFRRRQIEQARRELAVLRSYDRARLTPSQRLSADILEWQLDSEVRDEPFLYHNYPVNQLFGVQSELPTFMVTMHQINRKRDAVHYIKRLSKFGIKFDQVVDGLQVREARGIIPPPFVVEKVLAQMRSFVGQPSQSHLLYTTFIEKVNALNGVSDGEKRALRREADEQIKRIIYPAYAKLIAYFETLRPKSTSDAGVWKLPDGDVFYIYALQRHTTTKMTPEEVHELGLAEVGRIEAELRERLDKLGIHCDKVGECLRQLNTDPRFRYPEDDTGRATVMADYKAILDEVKRRISGVFDLHPNVGVKVERVPAFKEKTAPGAYYNPPSFDGTRLGVFFVNLGKVNDTPKYQTKSLACHEAIPGHHFQLTIQQEVAGLPLFRKDARFTAYIEGWGLYAERLAWECGLYQEDPAGDIGRLWYELFRAVRLVVDTGIHHKRWTREQAMAYEMEHPGSPG